MKLSKFAFISLLFSLLIAACGSVEQDPEEVAESYLNYLNNKEYDKAKELGTENTRKMIDKFEFFGALNGAVGSGRAIIENIKCIVDGDKAICSFTADGESKEMILVRVDGKWLVDFDMGEEAIGDSDNTADTIVSDNDTIVPDDMVEGEN